MARSLSDRGFVDTVIIGNGPSALILSYILHGHIPYYGGGHHDHILDAKLKQVPNLLHLTSDLYAHFASSLRYSTQALPVNTLLDTLIRPNADTELNPKSCVEWRYEPENAVSHVAIGDAPHAGGQWADSPAGASADIGTLSYAEQLSLPGYSYADHLAKRLKPDQCDFVRPSRGEVADYLRAYPQAVGIADAVLAGQRVDGVYRTKDGFAIGSLGIRCKRLVLASGTFTVNIPPPLSLAPVTQLHAMEEPLLVVGSGFSAADVIISAPPTRRIIHLFQWAPEKRPSPLRGCHHTAYPEYATVYRQMKLAALSLNKNRAAKPPPARRKPNPFHNRDWNLYEGLPNAEITNVSISPNDAKATITIRLACGQHVTRPIGGLSYVVGRRGTLDFLSTDLRTEILGPPDQSIPKNPHHLVSTRTLRPKVESSTLEVAKNVFITGSLTGDSLIRHAVGGCVFAAARISNIIPSTYSPDSTPSPTISLPHTSRSVSPDDHDNHDSQLHRTSTRERTNGHADLHLDRRNLAHGVLVASEENKAWVGSGWWAGGLGPSAI